MRTGKRAFELRALSAVCALVLLAGCQQRVLPEMSLKGAHWKTFTDEQLGIRFEYPDVMQVDEGSAGLLLRYDGGTNLRVVWVDEESARRRGLWARHQPAGEADLGGRPAKRYLYNHWDGPSYVLTEAFVTPYRGKFLGLEFRPGGLPEKGRKQLLESFEFLDQPAN